MTDMQKYPRVSRHRLSLLTTALMSAGLLSHTASAQVQTAENLLVNVDATQAAEGPLTSIPSTGTLGGFFEANGPANARPTVAREGGTIGIRFDGSDYLTHVSQLGQALGVASIHAPPGLVGDSPTRSIEVWAFNPLLAGEETLVSWGKRGGPDGSNISFNYGSDFRWGAIGHWGNPDIGWNNNGGGPAAGKWHHLVYTFDGTMTRVYSDGQLSNAEQTFPGLINTHEATAINIGAQWEANGETVTPTLRFSGTIAKVRVHDGVLTDAQIKSNYEAERAQFIDPAAPPPIAAERLPKAPLHRYSFSEPANSNPTGTEFKDSLGTAHGTVLGAGGSLTGSRLVLPGGPSADAAYADLPNGLLSSKAAANGGSGEFTFETWAKLTGSRTWSRIFDFGSTTLSDGSFGEVTEPGGAGEGRDYFMLSAQIDNNTSQRRLEVRNEDPAGGGIATADHNTAMFNNDTHLVVSWNESSGSINAFENGRLVSSLTTDDKMSDIKDVNVWLGRSNWGNDQNMQGEFDEVRIYNYVLGPGQVFGNTLAGPDILNDRDTPVVIAVHPASRTVPETLPVTFRVDARGSSPVSFQWFRNGSPIAGATSSSYTIDAATASDNTAQFTVEVSNTVNGSAVRLLSNPATLSVISDTLSLRHRYSFNQSSGPEVPDAVGSAHGTLVGGGSFDNGQLTLDGVDGYVDLPNGIVSALGTNATIEMWVTYPELGAPWTRIFDFGISNVGEEPGGNGVDFLFYTARTGDGFPRFTANFPGGGDVAHLVHPGSMPVNQQEHVVVTWSNTGNVARLYTNGVLVATSTAPRPISALAGRDLNNWLGQSQWSADAHFAGAYNEFRLYSGAMTPSQVAASFQAGPDSLPIAAPNLAAQITGANLLLSWPADAAGFELQSTTSLSPATQWTSLGAGAVAGNRRQITVPLDSAARFFRLRKS